MKTNKIQLLKNERTALRIIRSWFLHKGRNPSIRELTKEMNFGSTRSALLLINRLIDKKALCRKEDGSLRILNDLEKDDFSAKTVDVPLVGTVSCGAPIFAEENIEAFYSVSITLAHPGFSYFLLRAKGDSMDMAGIKNGDIVLVKQQPTAETGQKVVALIDDEAVIKVIKFTPEAIILEPKSTDKKHKPIILSKNFQIQGVVVTSIPFKSAEPLKKPIL